MENCNASEPMAKKSLITALENLEQRACALEHLADFSNQVVLKFNDPRPTQESASESMIVKNCAEAVQSDLIDLFNSVAERIDIATHRIGNNTEQIQSIIE